VGLLIGWDESAVACAAHGAWKRAVTLPSDGLRHMKKVRPTRAGPREGRASPMTQHATPIARTQDGGHICRSEP
jgi:hypothetical protein